MSGRMAVFELIPIWEFLLHGRPPCCLLGSGAAPGGLSL